MGSSNPDEKILSYNDVVLRRSDLDILNGPHFLNDRLIEFYFSHVSSIHHCHDVLLVSPSISFWIMNCPVSESLRDFVDPLDLPAKKLILFPVNDNDDVTIAGGGSHWSLVVYHRYTNTFYHHDSNNGMNEKSAKRLYRMVSGFVSDPDSVSDAKYVKCSDSPQQTNGHDCGLYVAAIARAIWLWQDGDGGDTGDDTWFPVVKEKVTPSAVSAMRDEISRLIRGLMVAN